MSHFYGTLQGGRGETTRTGTKNSGLTAIAASWRGAAHSELYVLNGIDCVRVCLIPWKGSGQSEVVVYEGPLHPDDNTVAPKEGGN